MITQSELKDLFSYDKNTGVFTWKTAKAKCIHVNDIAGTKHSNGYIYIKVGKRNYFAHRLAWLYEYGVFPANMLDHINGIKDDNSILNLREAINSQNQHNSKTPKHNTSGIKGVNWDSRSARWKAQLQTNGVRKILGYFERIEDAESAIKQYREQQHREFANHG